MTQPEQPGMPDMQELIRQAAEVQAQIQRAQEEILAAVVQGTAGGGLVNVTMTGGAEITDPVSYTHLTLPTIYSV